MGPMNIELKMLSCSILLGLAYVLIAGALSTRQRGITWNAGNRDGEAPPLSNVAARADRAARNFLETFAFFVAAVLAVLIAQREDARTAIGAQMYFWARAVYLPVYIIGIPYLRSLVWLVSVAGILLLVGAALGI